MSARVKPNWEKPAAPICEKCGAAFKLYAIQDNGGWALQWNGYCPECDHDLHCNADEGITSENEWPFEDDYVFIKDWEALGIETEWA